MSEITTDDNANANWNTVDRCAKFFRGGFMVGNTTYVAAHIVKYTTEQKHAPTSAYYDYYGMTYERINSSVQKNVTCNFNKIGCPTVPTELALWELALNNYGDEEAKTYFSPCFVVRITLTTSEIVSVRVTDQVAFNVMCMQLLA